MHSLRHLLPGGFSIKTPIAKTPADLFDFLTGLYDREQKLHPDIDYLQVHGLPQSIYNHVRTFAWYLPFLPASGKVLDWGCNHAPDSCMVRALFGDALDIYGCDFREPGLFTEFDKAARFEYRKIPNHIHIPFENNMFDVVIASGSLEHAVMDYRSLEELYRILKPEGKLIISFLPNRCSYYEWIKEHISKKDFHPRRYGLFQAKELLRHNGFFPIEASSHNFLWEKNLAKIGIKGDHRSLVRFLSFIFPIHLAAGCHKLIAIKKTSM
jgi:SAM-dependent methyltransferase